MAKQVGILLTPDFGLTSFSSIVEVLRSSNTLHGSTLYDWQIVAARAGPVASTAGVSIVAGPLPGALQRFDTVFLPAAGNPALFEDTAIHTWLRRLHRHGTRLVGVSGGAFLLAKAGLLKGHRFTIHWEHVDPLREAFPDLVPEETLYELDRTIATAAGGIATFDLMLTLLAMDHGPAFSARVGDWLLHSRHRPGSTSQRVEAGRRNGIAHDGLSRIIEHIERHAHEPLALGELARLAGLSGRQLERLFGDHLGTSVHRHVAAVRLSRARVLLRQTRLPVAEIAAASGYGSPSHFTQAYRARFGLTPRAERTLERQRLRGPEP
ncbi:GlxA family transcriptional regulator [Muricoccus radiodurans]|uniref:GlxA family transcriptional regulator n=1 Tax=Muricoccus radiodurans TaxID=2231721 RepID=UPI003CF69413